MNSIDCDNLKIEINRFIDLLKQIESSLIDFPLATNDCCSMKIEIVDRNEAESVFKSMKSNAIIMLYNFVEAGVRTTMYDYYTYFNNKKFTYSTTILEIKKLWIQHKTKEFKENYITDQVFDMIENSINNEYKVALDFDKDFSLSGNADVREIKTILDRHGLQYEVSQFKDYGGSLRTIKDMRNRLAHGNISFEDNGKGFTLSDLEQYRNQTYDCMQYFMEVVKSSFTEQLV
ncbi:hypothetical protein N42HA_00301 [Lactococcus lactis]|uniref:MAE-28990/MAE-18760-like HEPN domain-containing protein n=1 Tax=Lactococcus lactis subsp. lactis TaxID=1360 RepID=A0A0V8ELW1_LACLL|nr:MAE_28990/MAE_18760 family HEPN-like nuclease [Lactococcus lactis]KSU26870.1 hypothetical protein N42_1405 [Lactococcus lactis subsp. lactis]MDU0407315.1 hypothetical protein [Lactococcus lactis]TRW67785.1 hypothetical protein FNJ58_11875 [Lactococcus lactis]